MPLLDRPLPLVGEVVGRAGKRVDRGDVAPHVPGTSRDATGKFS